MVRDKSIGFMAWGVRLYTLRVAFSAPLSVPAEGREICLRQEFAGLLLRNLD